MADKLTAAVNAKTIALHGGAHFGDACCQECRQKKARWQAGSS